MVVFDRKICSPKYNVLNEDQKLQCTTYHLTSGISWLCCRSLTEQIRTIQSCIHWNRHIADPNWGNWYKNTTLCWLSLCLAGHRPMLSYVRCVNKTSNQVCTQKQKRHMRLSTFLSKSTKGQFRASSSCLGLFDTLLLCCSHTTLFMPPNPHWSI